MFLMPCKGDVAFTPWAHEAGRFEGLAEAVDTAALNCHEGFFVTEVLPDMGSAGGSMLSDYPIQDIALVVSCVVIWALGFQAGLSLR